MITIPSPPNSILELPLDWWLLLLEYLTAYEKLNLSHTCKSLRAVAMHEWPSQIRQLQSVERMQFISAFANTSLDHWLCFDCRKLRKVNFFSTPRSFIHIWYGCCPTFGFRGQVSSCYNDRYFIHGGHLQIALKYTRRNRLGVLYRKYLEKLLDPISIASIVKRKTTTEPHVLAQYSAHPKITNDRYLLAEEWRLTPCNDQSSPVRGLFKYEYLERTFRDSTVCKHLRGMGTDAPEDRIYALDPPLVKPIKLALSLPPGEVVSLTCDRCPTDVVVGLEQNDQGCQTLRMRAWKDMGEARAGPVLPDEWTSRREFRLSFEGRHPFQPRAGDYRSLYENGVRLSSLQASPGPPTANKATAKDGPGQPSSTVVCSTFDLFFLMCTDRIV